MASIISTKTSGGGGIAVTGDTSGIMQLASNDGTRSLDCGDPQSLAVSESISCIAETAAIPCEPQCTNGRTSHNYACFLLSSFR